MKQTELCASHQMQKAESLFGTDSLAAGTTPIRLSRLTWPHVVYDHDNDAKIYFEFAVVLERINLSKNCHQASVLLRKYKPTLIWLHQLFNAKK